MESARGAGQVLGVCEVGVGGAGGPSGVCSVSEVAHITVDGVCSFGSMLGRDHWEVNAFVLYLDDIADKAGSAGGSRRGLRRFV